MINDVQDEKRRAAYQRIQDRFDAGAPEASVEKQFSEVPEETLPHDPEWLAEFMGRTPKSSRPDTPARSPRRAPSTVPDAPADGYSASGLPIRVTETRMPIPDDGSAGDAMSEQPVAADAPARSVIRPEDSVATDGPSYADDNMTLEAAPPPESDVSRRKMHAIGLDRSTANMPAKALVADPPAEPIEIAPPVVQGQMNLPEAEQGMMPVASAGDEPPPSAPDAAPTPANPQGASQTAVAQGATPAAKPVADTLTSEQDLLRSIREHAARKLSMGEQAALGFLRGSERGNAIYFGRKPDSPYADDIDAAAAANQKEALDQFAQREAIRRYAADRADKDRAFGLQERALAAKERPVARPGKTQEQIDAESRARLALMEAQRNKAMQPPAGGDGWGGDTGGAVEQFSPEAIDRLATFYNKTGGSLPPLGVGKTAASIRGRIISRAAEMAGAAGEPDLATAKAAFGADTGALRQASNLGAKIASSEGTVRGNMDVLREASKDLVRTPIPLVNKPLIWLQANVAGVPAASKFLNAIGTVTNEYSSVMTLNGSQGSTDAARAKAESMINQGLTDGTLGQVLDQMEQEMENRIRSNKATIAGIRQGIGGSGPESAPRVAKVKVTDKNGKSKMLDPAAAEKYRGVAGFTVE